MKIRILGDTLRIRLKKSEIEHFEKNGKIEDSITFTQNNILKYTIKVCTKNSISSTFENNEIIVFIPKEVAKNWINSNLVTLENNLCIPQIIIEKDFKCTSKSCLETDEQIEDSFNNPNSKC